METDALSDGQIAGQRIMAGFDGQTFNDDLKYLIGEIQVGGIILFSRNLSDPKGVGQMCLAAQEYAAECGQPPLFISIDQEGGVVARLKEPFEQFPGAAAMTQEADAVYFAQRTASDLTRIGINMNMAPVMDTAPNSPDSPIRGRSFGNDPKWVSKMGIAVINGLWKNRVVPVAKHFPGIGGTTLDSHLEMPTFAGDQRELESFHLIPFEAAVKNPGVKNGVPCIMISHVLYPDIDPIWPASLSRKISHTLLRKKMGYDGVTITDDLDMGAIKKRLPIQTVIERVMAADIDIALICHKGPDIKAARHEMIRRAKDPLARAMHLKSAERIQRLKGEFWGLGRMGL